MKKGANWIDRTLIESPYSIGLCQTEAQYRHELKRLKVPNHKESEWIASDKDGCVTEVIKSDGHGHCYIVSIRATKTTQPIEVIGLIIHEAVHVWQFIREGIGEDEPSHEFEAYSIQRIAQNLIDAYNISKRK
jgi:hypothetical protein